MEEPIVAADAGRQWPPPRVDRTTPSGRSRFHVGGIPRYRGHNHGGNRWCSLAEIWRLNTLHIESIWSQLNITDRNVIRNANAPDPVRLSFRSRALINRSGLLQGEL